MCSSSKPLIEFPCEYPIKIIGDGSSVFTDHIESVMTNTIGLGNYSNQLRRIHHHLKASNSVKMVI